VHQAAAARQISVGPAAAAAKPNPSAWLPHKDEAGNWVAGDVSTVDLTQLSLADLPPLDTFIEIVTTSPQLMPHIPIDKLINNTLTEWTGKGSLPSSSQEWLQLLQGAGQYVLTSLPGVAASLPDVLNKVLPTVNVNGQDVPLLASMVTDAAKFLQSLPVEVTPEGLRLTVGDAQLPPINLDSLKDVPAMLQKVGQVVVQTLNDPPQLPNLADMVAADGTIDLGHILQTTFNISLPSLPPPPPAYKVVADLAKALPKVASALGLNTTGIAFPDVDAIAGLLKLANGDKLFVADKSGRLDLLATLTELPAKLPQLAGIVQQLPPPPSGWPKVQDVVGLVAKVVPVALKLV
jgi:hypothetical protein